jgi:hypothetical protein
MKKANKIVIIIWALAISFVCLYVPWGEKAKIGYSEINRYGYAIIGTSEIGTILYGEVIIAILGITAFCVALYVFLELLKKQ